ncbi:hypothetical protein OAO34_04685 [Candidatus Poseidoniaceae archaeon]|nr:hypothetical protein [Candidatus Poseidoniaceae archaeon]
MGLLDKVDNLDETKPAKAVAKKAVAKKAVAKKATPKAAVAKKATPKAAAKKPRKEKAEKIRPTGLPEGFELSGTMPRYIGWLINFAWNFGVLIGTLSVFAFGDPDMTIPFIGAALMIIINWLVIPIWLGRNIGEFVARTKYINSSGSKPNPVHAVLNNSLGFMFLIGFILIAVNLSDISSSGGKTSVGIGFFLVIIWVVNFFLKKNSDYSQGMFDLLFSAYSVKHVSTGSETGWLAKFEGLGDLGDKFEKRQDSRREKAAKKADAKKAVAKAKPKDSEDDEKKAEDEPSDSED